MKVRRGWAGINVRYVNRLMRVRLMFLHGVVDTLFSLLSSALAHPIAASRLMTLSMPCLSVSVMQPYGPWTYAFFIQWVALSFGGVGL
jgi:hypothetical protein